MNEIVYPIRDRETGPGTNGVRVGRIVSVSGDGKVWVDFPGNPGKPVIARTIARIGSGVKSSDYSRPVLLAFEANELSKPLILGIITEEIFEPPASAFASLSTSGTPSAVVDGERLVLDATREIVLRCGDSSITLRKDGTILLKGSKIVSRASQQNKIRGASVSIN